MKFNKPSTAILTLAITAVTLNMAIGQAWAAGLDARINTAQVARGDTLQLALTTNSSMQVTPDLTPLSHDFDVLGTSQSSQTQIVNGQVSHSKRWVVTLSPLNEGMITIPALEAGTLSSEPLSVDVIDASQLPKLQGASGIALSANIEGGSHYRFQEIPLTLRIESLQPLQSAQLIPPDGDFELTQTGQQRQGQVNRRGRLVHVVEQSYLLRPQVEGALEIPPFTLQGTVQDPHARSSYPFASTFGERDPFARMEQMMVQLGGGMPFGSMTSRVRTMFGAKGKPFVARSDAHTLDILVNPVGDSSDWFLPAKSVQLQSEWLSANPVFREGEAVVRRISVFALGARSEQLPDLQFEDPVGARIYVDDIKTDTIDTAEGTMARRDFSISVVPTQGGEVILPEIAVDWLNTVTGETQTATLAAEKISVEGTVPTNANVMPGGASIDNAATTTAVDSAEDRQQWLLGSALAAALLSAVLVGAGWSARRRREDETDDTAVKLSGRISSGDEAQRAKASDALTRLRKAARASDTSAFYSALLGLRNQPEQADPDAVEDAIAAIDNVLYCQDASRSELNLGKMLENLKANKTSARGLHRAARQLPPLYPGAAQ